MNASDSERIASLFLNAGLVRAQNAEEADIIVVTMCSVRQSAADRIFGLAHKFQNLRAKNPRLKTILTGCVTASDSPKFKAIFDFVLDIKTLPDWGSILGLGSRNPGLAARDYFCVVPNRGNSFSAAIPVSKGCDNYCAYCVVPYTRGPLVSRNWRDIVGEAENAVESGAKEIWLLGQNVNNYLWKEPGKKAVGFGDLLRKIDAIPGDFWIRFTSPHPKDFFDETIAAMAECGKFAPYLNLPVQSGDNRILKRMARPYTAGRYKKLAGRLRAAFAEHRSGTEAQLALSTDVIVGFPGETKKQFANTAKLFRSVRYDMAYIARYSPRPGTAAAALADDVPDAEKKRRYAELTGIVMKTALANNEFFVGKTVDVLVDAADKKNHFASGKSRAYKTVRFDFPPGAAVRPGDIRSVKISAALPTGLSGRLAEPPKERLIVVLGPTASGKSDLAVSLARKFNGEVVSADSRQVYRGLDIGSGKITKKEMKSVPHHLLDVANPGRTYTAARYAGDAAKAIEKIRGKGKIPILAGGTGFYIQAVTEGLAIPEVKPDWSLRRKLSRKTPAELFDILEKLDPRTAGRIERDNPRRLIRAVEIVTKTGKPVPELKISLPAYPILYLGMARTKEQLRTAIKKRLEKRLKKGMLSEVAGLRRSGLSWKRLENFGLEYRYAAQYLQRKISRQKMTDLIQKESEHYAKRQMTWFKRNPGIHWVKNAAEAFRLAKLYLSDEKEG